jgi:hypothetical protein
VQVCGDGGEGDGQLLEARDGEALADVVLHPRARLHAEA